MALRLGDWTEGDGSLYRRLAAALTRAVDRGDLVPGTVLPPERALAKALSVSRATVVSAYEYLKDGDLLDARQGSGTWVRDDVGEHTPITDGLTSSIVLGSLDERAPGADPDVIEFTTAAVSAPPELAEAARTVLADPHTQQVVFGTHGYLPAGLPELRDQVVQLYLDSDTPTARAQIVITSGAQQGISLLARHLVHPGDTVIVESPTYPAALDAFRAAGARLHGVPVGPHGVDVEALRELVVRLNPRLVYLVATYHNPTGGLLPLEARRQIAEMSRDHRVPVIEDRTLAQLGLDDPAVPPPIAAFAEGAEIHTVGSMSKVYWAGLRVGWLRVSEALAAQLARLKAVDDLGTPIISQLLSSQLIPQRDAIAAARRLELRPKRDLLVDLLRHHVPDWRFDIPRGGLTMWLELPRGSAEEYVQVAARYGVIPVAGPVLSPEEGNRRFLRVPFTLPPAALEEGVERLARAWRDYAPRASSTTGDRPVV